MKKFSVSTLTAISLALPLGIGGAVLAAPIVATPAEAWDLLEWLQAEDMKTEEILETCSHQTYRACDPTIRDQVAYRNPDWKAYFDPGDLPDGSNGVDQAAYDHFAALATQTEQRLGSSGGRNIPLEIFEDIFPGGLSPDDKQKLDEYQKNEFELEAAFRDHCIRARGGIVKEAELGRSISCDLSPVAGYPRTVFLDQLGENPTGFQVTPVEPLGSLADIADIEAHQQVTLDNRTEIVELQGEVNSMGENLDLLGERVGVAFGALAALGAAVGENRKGIALSYALSNVPSTISSNSRGAVSGGFGHFEDENAVAFGLTFRFTPRLTGNVGGGFDTGEGNSVSGARAGLVWEFGSMGN